MARNLYEPTSSMGVVAKLASEHALIAEVLTAFEQFVRRAEAKAPVGQDLNAFVDFFRGFMDLNHHDKEETILFPTLVRHGLAWDEPPLAELRHEHRLERYLLRSLRQAALQTEHWSDEDLRHWLGVAREFMRFCRQHMQREDPAFTTMVEGVLSSEAQTQLDAEFQRFDADLERSGELTRWRQLAERLIHDYHE